MKNLWLIFHLAGYKAKGIFQKENNTAKNEEYLLRNLLC